MLSSRKKTICPLDCPDTCGMIATLEHGRVTELRGDPDHPYTHGFICRKMRRYLERVYGEQRLLYPQRRVGTKGTASFERISWDDALDQLAEKLSDTCRQYGGSAIMPWVYAGNMGVVHRFAGYPLLHRLGATMIKETICSSTARAGWNAHCQNIVGSPPEKAENADLIVAWGINIKVTNIHFWQYVARARSRGAKLVVVDPYRNETAAAADYHLPVRPAGDVALALACLKLLKSQKNGVLHEEGHDHVARQAHLAHILEATPLETLLGQCGVQRQLVEDLVRLLARRQRIFFRIGAGMTRNSRGAMAVRAVTTLAHALGLFTGGPGQGVLFFSGAFSGDKAALTHPELAPAPLRRVNMIHLGHALTALDPPIRVLLNYNANPLSSAPDSSQVRRGLAREDLFTMVHEQVMTPTARYADLLLPATTFLENRDLYTAYGHFYLGVTEPVIAPVGEAMSNFELFQQLAQRMGYDEPVFYQSVDERLVAYFKTLKGLPADCKTLPAPGRYIRSTHWQAEGCSGTFLATAKLLYPSVPGLIRADEFDNPDMAARYPFLLITPPHRDLLNSTLGDLLEAVPGEVLVHPEDAAAAGIVSGAPVVLENARGCCERVARVSDATQPGLLVAEGLFWPQYQFPSAINELTSQKEADQGEGPMFHESRVALRVRSVKDASKAPDRYQQRGVC
ncbi:MAG: molybdopterin oxidoreductase [Deltaproteobacteria bacterium]|nr:MAG: molybdopterin oxidoreductase [Deltaproteobacteria bacterium]